MGGVALSALTVFLLLSGCTCGLASALILRKTDLDRHVAFGWGAILGPLGVSIALVIARRRRSTLKQGVVLPWE